MSITTDFNKRTDKAVKFATFKKTWVDPSKISGRADLDRRAWAIKKNETRNLTENNVNIATPQKGTQIQKVSGDKKAPITTGKTRPPVKKPSGRRSQSVNSSGRNPVEEVNFQTGLGEWLKKRGGGYYAGAEQDYEAHIGSSTMEDSPASAEPPASGDDRPIWEKLGMTRDEYIAKNNAINQLDHENEFGTTAGEGEIYDPYAALQARNMSGGTGNVSGYINAGQATAIRNKYIEGAGATPEKARPSEGESWTPEQELQAEADHQRALKEWWKKVGEASMEDVSDVVSLTQDQMSQTKGYQEQVASLVANLNQSDPPMGAAMSSVLEGVNSENLTPDILSKLQVLAESDIQPSEFTTKAQALINDQAISSNMSTLGINSTPEGYDMGNGVIFTKGSDGAPLLGIDNIPANATAADLLKMEAALSTSIGEKGLQTELELWGNYSKSVLRALSTAKEEIAYTMGDARNKLAEAELSVMNEQKYNKRRLEINKDRTLSNIMEQEAQMEGYLKAQLESWGADTSTAALTILQKNKLKFTKQYTEAAQDYDLELSRVSDKMTEAQMAFTNRSIELAHQEISAVAKVNDGLLDNLDKIQTGVTSAFRNKDMKDMQIIKDYISGLRQLNSAEAEAEQEAYKDTRDFNFKLMKEYSDNSGYQYEMLPDGSIQIKTDAGGRPQLTQSAKRKSSSITSPTGSVEGLSSKEYKTLSNLGIKAEGGRISILEMLKQAQDPDNNIDRDEVIGFVKDSLQSSDAGRDILAKGEPIIWDFLADISNETDELSPNPTFYKPADKPAEYDVTP